MPSCDEDGNFAKSQKWGSTGQSWCSSINGNRVPGTLTGPTEQAWDCGECLSFCQWSVTGQWLVGYRSVCEYKLFAAGSCSTVKCHVAEGCAIVPWTTKNFSYHQFQASHTSHPISENLPACLAKEATLAHLLVEGMYPFGLDRPECDGEGKFVPTQCHGSTGYCWCVEPETGKEIEGELILEYLFCLLVHLLLARVVDNITWYL